MALLLGLCGNATAGIEARNVPVVMPRAHDCCTVFLGSRERFREHFADNPSRPFSSAGYLERGDEYVQSSTTGSLLGLDRPYEEYLEMYGEENARYIVDTLTAVPDDDGKMVYIDVPETSRPDYAERLRATAAAEGKEFLLVEGDLRLIRMLLHGQWGAQEFLVVQPGQRIQPVYDWTEVVRAAD